jgi:hypothetical protein
MWGPQWKQKTRARLLVLLVVKWQSLPLRKGQSMSAKLVAKSVWKHIKHALGMHVCWAPGKPSCCLQISWSPRSPPKSQQPFFPGTYLPLHSFIIFMIQFQMRERERERERENLSWSCDERTHLQGKRFVFLRHFVCARWKDFFTYGGRNFRIVLWFFVQAISSSFLSCFVVVLLEWTRSVGSP